MHISGVRKSHLLPILAPLLLTLVTAAAATDKSKPDAQEKTYVRPTDASLMWVQRPAKLATKTCPRKASIRRTKTHLIL